ncbi:transporter substrate-binding domain-containing protein [Scrofimicrobium sp. R131]|uniref:Transporter substrate-binding domain-containing protein n=1 Tax=Scrofimicrobium appendicitidis TaxID=3079930 RepID=A0AAU7VBL9_9ACTO
MVSSRARRRAGVALALGLAGVLSACTSPVDISTPSQDNQPMSDEVAAPTWEVRSDIAAMVPDEIASEGRLRNGISLSNGPGSYLDPQHGNLTGFDVDLSQAIGQVMGLEQTVQVPVQFSHLLQNLGADYDLATSMVTVTSQRLENANFVTYAETGTGYLIKTGNPHNFDPESPCGQKVVAQSATVQEQQLKLLSELCAANDETPIQILTRASLKEVLTALREDAGIAAFLDAIAIDSVTSEPGSRLVPIGKITNKAPLGIAVSKDNPQLTVAVQAAVQYLMDEGFVRETFEKYGVGDAALASSVINPRVD